MILPLGSANMPPCFGENDSFGYFKSAPHMPSSMQFGEPIIPISLQMKKILHDNSRNCKNFDISYKLTYVRLCNCFSLEWKNFVYLEISSACWNSIWNSICLYRLTCTGRLETITRRVNLLQHWGEKRKR